MKSIQARWLALVGGVGILAGAVAAESPHACMQAPDLAAGRWTGGFWGDRVSLCRTRTLDAIEAAMRCPTNGALLCNFELAGVEGARHRGTTGATATSTSGSRRWRGSTR
jgi:hypothetical protein